MECHANNITAYVQSDHVLHGYVIPVFFATDQLHCPPRNKMLPQLVSIADWHSIYDAVDQ